MLSTEQKQQKVYMVSINKKIWTKDEETIETIINRDSSFKVQEPRRKGSWDFDLFCKDRKVGVLFINKLDAAKYALG